MSKVRLATVWLDGCSGCHMSFLDMDMILLDLAPKIDLVYSPLVDFKVFPENVDVTIVEGAVSSTEDEEKIKHIRGRTKTLIALGDCAITSNVPGMRNTFSVDTIMTDAYGPDHPVQVIPPLLDKSVPVHHVVPVDVFITGCPPPAGTIVKALLAVLEGQPNPVPPRFG
ncbi:MAG TPA: NADP oxidoreductase [Kiritimatiellia bacterium]|nr:NADP oxidoreductase [Kiritimatiellia bacterium]HMO99992.1 NADP oxidoreductase [Kiritimatiellia bacterium]HMP74496.1 NADP oxidoreductase [Kiritimatiellia bacterium]